MLVLTCYCYAQCISISPPLASYRNTSGQLHHCGHFTSTYQGRASLFRPMHGLSEQMTEASSAQAWVYIVFFGFISVVLLNIEKPTRYILGQSANSMLFRRTLQCSTNANSCSISVTKVNLRSEIWVGINWLCSLIIRGWARPKYGRYLSRFHRKSGKALSEVLEQVLDP